jgi:putative ABC transport system permease protein
MDIKILAGRNFDRSNQHNRDSARLQFLVNETYLRKFGFTQDEVIGRRIWLGVAGKGEIIGIVNDFHTGSLHQPIEPVIIYNEGGWINKFIIKLYPGDVQQQLAEVGTVWKKFAPHRPFAYSFLDENYNNLYKTEIRINRLVHLFSGLAIIIACLGILGLASYSATQRAKEIGIRKVLGASTSGIMFLMAKDFLILVGISFALAIPVAYFLSSDWLHYFRYRISISVFHFVLSGVVAFVFAMMTIGYQTFRASRTNPAETLKAE